MDLKKLQQLLEQQKFDEFKKEVVDFLASPISDEEREDFNIKLMSVYLDVRNRMDAAYIEYLDDCLAVIKDVDNTVDQTIKEKEVESVRDKLKSLT